MEISRKTCVLLFSTMGFEGAAEWGKREMRSRLATLNEIVPENYEIGERNIDTVLDEIIACNNEDEIIELAKEDGREIRDFAIAARELLQHRPEETLNRLHDFIRRDAELAELEANTHIVEEVSGELAQKPAKIVYEKIDKQRDTEIKSQLTLEREKKAAHRNMVLDSLFTPDTPIVDPNSKFENVRYAEGRPFYAGVVLARFGNEKGVTEQLISELDEYLPGKPEQSRRLLCMAWHIVNGYVKMKLEGFKDYVHEQE